MKKKILIIAFILIATAAIAAMIYGSSKLHEKEVNEDNHLIELSFEKLEEKINNKESFILVITQTKCSHCAEYKPKLKKTLTKYNITAYEIAEDKLSEKNKTKLKDIANTSVTPVTIFIKNGEEVNTTSRIVGSTSVTKIESRLKAMGYIK